MVARSSIVLAAATVVVAVVLSSGASWVVASLASSSTKPASETADTGSTSGTAATGATGPQGAQGSPGAAGQAGATGPSGASAPTFSATSASGIVFSTGPFTDTFSTQTVAVPAGPALVGFSVALSTDFPEPTSYTCSLIDAGNPATVLATTASIVISGAAGYSTFATTQVVSLAQATPLTVECTSAQPFFFELRYESLSIYAISFATP